MAGIMGFGGYVPEHVMTNEDWAKLLDTSDEWITARTGIKERRIAAAHETTVTMAAEAAKRAIAGAGLEPGDIGEIIIATDTPEVYTPDTASFLQHLLGIGNVAAFDLGGSGCAGFVQAMDIARARIGMGIDRILVVGVELISRLVSQKDRATSVLFGDGAGAVVMGLQNAKAKVLDVVCRTDGSKTDILTLATGGSRFPFTLEAAIAEEHRNLVMDGRRVFKEAVQRMSEAVTEVVGRVGRTIDDINLLVPHQANKRIIDAVGSRLGLGEDRVYINVQDYGNTGSASVPLALWEAVEKGRVKEGDFVVLTAFGAGFHWAAAAIQF